MPFGFILYLFTDQIVLLLLGNKWFEVVPIVKILAFFGIIRAVTSATYPIFLSLKKQSSVMVITMSGIAGLGIFILPLVGRYGVVGAAYAALIGTLFSLPIAAYLTWDILRKLK